MAGFGCLVARGQHHQSSRWARPTPLGERTKSNRDATKDPPRKTGCLGRRQQCPLRSAGRFDLDHLWVQMGTLVAGEEAFQNIGQVKHANAGKGPLCCPALSRHRRPLRPSCPRDRRGSWARSPARPPTPAAQASSGVPERNQSHDKAASHGRSCFPASPRG